MSIVSFLPLSGCSAAAKRPMVGTEMRLESAGQDVYILFISYPHLNPGRNQERRQRRVRFPTQSRNYGFDRSRWL